MLLQCGSDLYETILQMYVMAKRAVILTGPVAALKPIMHYLPHVIQRRSGSYKQAGDQKVYIGKNDSNRTITLLKLLGFNEEPNYE